MWHFLDGGRYNKKEKSFGKGGLVLRFLHLGDLHIGKSVNEIDLLEDQKVMLQKVLDLVTEREIHAVLLAGDIYDRAVPSEAAVRVLDDFLTALAEREVKVLAVSGNHDSDERLHFLSGILSAHGIYMQGCYRGGGCPCVSLEDAYGTVNFYLLPYIKGAQVRSFFPEEEIKNYEDAVRVVLSHTEIKKGERNVILSHQFVTCGGNLPELGGSEMPAVSLGTIDNISASVYDDFDYVALGHIHKSQAMGRDTVRYSGSLLKYSLREWNQKKEFPIVEMKEKGNLSMEFAVLPPPHEMRHVKGTYAELMQGEPSEDYMYITLTDEDIIKDAMQLMRQIYPNAMKLDYDNSHTRGLSETLEGADDCRSFEEIMRDFYRAVIGGEPTGEEWEILNEAARKAGVMG